MTPEPQTESRGRPKGKAEHNDTVAKLLAAFILPMIDWADSSEDASKRGRKALLMKKFREAAFPQTVSRMSIEKWIHKDPAKRTQPMLGHALLLQEVARKLGAFKKAKTTDHPTK